MDKDHIRKIVESGESQEVEFKESFHSSQEFSKMMCGLANTYGGVIIIGVNKRKEIVGIKEDTDEVQQRISSCAQAVSPSILPSIELHELEGKKIVLVIVQRAIDNAFHTFQGVIWAKVGSTLKKIEGNQIVEFLRAKQILCFDETPSTAGTSDIDIGLVKEYLSARKQTGYFSSHSIEDFLISKSLATRNGQLRIKNSALLFFAKDPMKFNPQTEIKLARFDGTEAVKILSHELVQANIVESIEKSISFVKANLPKSISIKSEARREETYQFPLDVVREAIVNAVAHRDYFSKDAIQIYLFEDRMEITNPGSLPQGLPQELFGTLSVQRNPITYHMLRDYDYVEGLGSGVPRMINSMREHGLSDPKFGIYEHFFRVVLKKSPGAQKPVWGSDDLNERQRNAIEFLKANKSMKTKMYMELNKVSLGTARLDIDEMIKFSYLKKIGASRGTYYILDHEAEIRKRAVQ